MDFYSLSFYSLALSLPFILLLLPLVSVYFLKQKNNHVERPNLPPSPPKLPIIGHLHQLGMAPHRWLWQQSKIYGPVMLIHLGRVPMVVVSTAEMAKEVFKTHDLDCCARPLQIGPQKLSYNYSDVVFAPHGVYWRELRKIFALELFGPKRLQTHRFVREDEVARMINSISQASASPINLTEKLFSLTDNIICRVAFGRSYEGKVLDNGRLHELLGESLVIMASFNATDFFPPLGWTIDMLTGIYAKIEKHFNLFDGFYQRIIDEHLDPERPKSEHEDILDVLLRLEREEYGTIRLTKDHVKAILMNIFVGAVGTSSITMVWAMAELAMNPRVMRKVQDEIRSYVGRKGKVEESDLDQFQYLKMVVKETLRLHPPGPLLLPRETTRHFKVDGYDIYPKTRIVANVWGIMRDPKYWENPEEFFPDRFMDSSINFQGQDFEFLPFGAGRRGCPGISMASDTMELALANLLYCFDWELPSESKKEGINMDDSPGITVHKNTNLFLVPVNYN